MSKLYTLHRTVNGWILHPGSSNIISSPESTHVFESTKSLSEKLPRIIDPEAAAKMIAMLPKRGDKGQFVPKQDKAA